MRPTRRYEGIWRQQGFWPVAGVDEAGRGCLAGPVVAAAVILGHRVPRGLNDSKQLSPARRDELHAALRASEACIGWGRAEAAEIDALNIRRASFLAMRRALANLVVSPAALLVDGFEIPGCDWPQRALVKGDARSLSIAAASIIAKVERDRIMEALDALHPGYDLRTHKGYPTPAHLRALAARGPSPLHRLTFAPVRDAKTCLTALPHSPKV